jgi:hypothetical protein
MKKPVTQVTPQSSISFRNLNPVIVNGFPRSVDKKYNPNQVPVKCP